MSELEEEPEEEDDEQTAEWFSHGGLMVYKDDGASGWIVAHYREPWRPQGADPLDGFLMPVATELVAHRIAGAISSDHESSEHMLYVHASNRSRWFSRAEVN